MKKAVIFAGFGVLVIAGLGGWFWSLGSISTEESPGIFLHVDQGHVQVRSQGSQAWRDATSDMVLQESDEVHTDETGRATIRFFDLSETRLHEGSILKIQQARHLPDSSLATAIDLKLELGRVWSRVLRLVDMESSFSVRTDSAVAAVRGTSFDVGRDATGTTVWVADSVVDVEGVGMVAPRGDQQAQETVVPEGRKTRMDEKGRTEGVRVMGDGEVRTPWFTQNIEEDAAFEKAMREDTARRLRGYGGVSADSSLRELARMSEALHLRLAGSKAPELYGRYLGRRLLAIKTLIDQGKSGLGFQALMGVEDDVRRLLLSSEGRQRIPAARRAIARFDLLLAEAGPSSPLYRLQQHLEDLDQALVGDDVAAKMFARLVAIDARLSVASHLIQQNALEEAGVSLDAARQGIENVARDFASATLTDTGRRTIIQRKLRVEKIREEAIRARLEVAITAPIPSVSVVPMDTTSSTAPEVLTTSTKPTTGAPTSTNSTPTPTSTPEIPLERIQLSIQPNPISVGTDGQLRVTGFRTDGSMLDVTTRATFTLLGQLGALMGSVYRSDRAGSVTVQATVIDQGIAKTASLVVQVNDITRVMRVELLPQSSTTITQGQRLTITVRVSYSNGRTVMAPTSSLTWQSSDPQIATVSAGLVSAVTPGSVIVTATYVENGVSTKGSLPLAVVATNDQPLSPTGL